VTQSTFSDLPATAQKAEPQASQPAGLSRPVTDFLIELSHSLQNRAMYPAGHPHLRSSSERLLLRTEALLEAEPMVVFGIARDQFVVGGAASDPRNDLFRDLAQRLHRHGVASLRLIRGVKPAELDLLVALLSGDPAPGSRAVDLAAKSSASDHVQLQPIEYERIVLNERVAGAESPPGAPRRSDDLWVDLAKLASESSPGTWAAEEIEPLILARTIDWGSADAGYDREMLGRLTRLVEEIAAAPNPRDQALHGRLSKLLAALRPGTLARLLAAGESDAERKRFILAASSALDVDAVMKVLEAVGSSSKQHVSHHLLRLLRKIGTIDIGVPQETKVAADAALRANVSRLLEDWRHEEPNPAMYAAAPDTMVGPSQTEGSRVEACDPIVILQTALECGVTGTRTVLATEEALSAGRLEEVVEMLQRAPGQARTEEIWQQVATPVRLRQELRRGMLATECTGAIITRLGTDAVDPLFELLGAADDRASRAATLRHLSGLGPPASQRAVALLPTAPWYMQRNLLVLLGRIGGWPAELPAAPYMAHADGRVRREAIKLMLETPGRRETGLAAGILDSDPMIRDLALSAALEGCSPKVVPMVRRLLTHPECGPQSRALAIRVLARSGAPDAVETLVNVALAKKFRFLRHRIAAKSPEVLAAVAGLASHWHEDPRAADVLHRARRHRDVEIRAAATPSA
jgi:hypothetical protein